ncbi:uncharacterized protein FIESC28_09315 [Fusarium coffeatum]|uniref:CorA-like transporter domain-containing protein n=1 Tax=Fusarium coffeatum TaxID=231269 RepID=A0A366R0U9_9HYPO|nr:uncharacterized protein FIESC28_09315 [Fusarium coffeatum]RBR10784.1 hypothetical protein FIESC28_09315 [Fusarium coffeatum]
MTECSYPDYLLKGTVLQNWLRNKYNDGTILVESKNGQYVFTLPNGAELTAVRFTMTDARLDGFVHPILRSDSGSTTGWCALVSYIYIATAMMNNYDMLKKSCREPLRYPSNLEWSCQRNSTLQEYQSSIAAKKNDLFLGSNEEIYIIEPNSLDEDGYLPIPQMDDTFTLSAFKQEVVRSPADLQKHLLKNRKDPHFCLIFLQSAHSRSELNCSHESFATLSSFYQIPASFLDFATSFGYTDQPLDYHMTGFSGDDTLDTPKSKRVEIPELGRSGCDHTTQYLLRAVERSINSSNEVNWNIRQMAVHHKYDFVNGRSLWVNIKTNKVMLGRVKEALEDEKIPIPCSEDGLSDSFAANMLIHLIHLEWCDESWRDCINSFEEQMRTVLEKAKTARFDEKPDLPANLKRVLTGTMKDTSSAPVGLVSGRINQGPQNGLLKSCWSLFTGAKQESCTPVQPVAPEKAGQPETVESNDAGKQLETLMAFSFKDVQNLYWMGEQLESFCLVIKLNRQTLRDIAEHYQDLASRDDFPQDIRTSCKGHLASFFRKIHRIDKNLEIRLTQIESLLSWLREGKALFDGILQYRSVQVSLIFTDNSQAQSQKMERIADKTEKETISMHVITCVTLAFLPGTFVAAFFQSGLVAVDEDANDVNNAVTLHSGAFKVFAMICFPLMAFTFLLWVFVFKFLVKRSSRPSEDEEKTVSKD